MRQWRNLLYDRSCAGKGGMCTRSVKSMLVGYSRQTVMVRPMGVETMDNQHAVSALARGR